MERGRVKWFDEEKGYGFIESDIGKKDYFVHRSNIVEQRPLVKGEPVEFEIGEGRKGPQAEKVRVLIETE